MYAGIVPAHLVLVCGVFGNVTAEDGRRTVATLRTLTEPSGYVVWTRGREATRDPNSEVREWFRQEGFTESSFIAPTAARFRVGMHRLNPALTMQTQTRIAHASGLDKLDHRSWLAP